MFKFIILGKPEFSDSPQIMFGHFVQGSFSGAIVWMHVHPEGVTQCAETLSIEEIGQMMGGN